VSAAPIFNSLWEDQDQDESYFISATNWGNSHYYSSDINQYYWDYGNGYIPFFAVIGTNNELYYGGNSVYSLVGPLNNAISEANLTPQNVNIEILGSTIRLSWDPVGNADYYEVYSSSDPEMRLNRWDLEESGITSTFWEEPSVDMKFYYVKSLTNSRR